MAPDLEPLLAAVVRDPGDDTARLAYADCLQECGNDARAAFIRLQVEAERLHPHSNARAALEARAQALFERHWVEWWGEVCAAVGLPVDGPAAYQMMGYAAVACPHPARFEHHAPSRFPIAFRRGFPESVAAPALSAGPEPCGSYLARWPSVSPLTELIAVGSVYDPRYEWPEGEHLRTVRRLALSSHTSGTCDAVISSAHLGAVDHLTLGFSTLLGRQPMQSSANLWVAQALAPKLRHFSAPLNAGEFVERVAATEPMPLLESLELQMSRRAWYKPDSSPSPTHLLATAPLTGVRRLDLQMLKSDDLTPLLRSPVWSALRHLVLDFKYDPDAFAPFCRGDELVHLEELHLSGVQLTTDAVRALADASRLKRVKHFALFGTHEDEQALPSLADAVDADRIETFAIGVPHFPERAANALRAKFGDRVRFLES